MLFLLEGEKEVISFDEEPKWVLPGNIPIFI